MTRTLSTLSVPLWCAFFLIGCGKSAVENKAAFESPQSHNGSNVISSCSSEEVTRATVSSLSTDEAVGICRKMALTLGHAPSVRLLRELSMAVSALRRAGATRDMVSDTHDIMRIVKARGQLTNDDSMIATFNVVYKILTGMQGRASLAELAEFLEALGPTAETKSDEGLMHDAAVISVMKKGY